MNVKEMFKELGYDQLISDDIIIYYKEEESITFRLEEKIFYKVFYDTAGNINMQELKAINKQIEELGWLKND